VKNVANSRPRQRVSQLGDSGSVDNKSGQITPTSSDRTHQLEAQRDRLRVMANQEALTRDKIVLKQEQLVRRNGPQVHERHVKNS